jgi:hypothetical protein
MDERPKLPHYDPDYCLKVAKWTASICIGILVVELLVLLLVTPDSAKCPGWTIYSKNGSAMPSWVLAGIFTGAPTAWICHVVMRWEQKFSQIMYDGIAYRDKRPKFPNLGFGRNSQLGSGGLEPPELNFEQIFLLNADAMFLRMCIGWCLFCAIPLFWIVTSCIDATRYLGY